ncbi:urotensin-2 receptor [Leucoraja erinacea]|uniref:urotensin-2 receptor n=1 Tax=Leucoraja erinaceus TaxID=7782 RepID=UPI002453F909|nr:urotensin-2 receptor [Leucoraja erinacea]XP_055507026.1 urotensin-2 receptor [Leucoraja erinacea]
MEVPGIGTQGNLSTIGNFSSSAPGQVNEKLLTILLGTILSAMCLMGVIGNVYVLVVMNLSMRFTGSMYTYIVNLALADLLYLTTIPFVVCTYFAKDWYFGELGCRFLLSLDFLTMHASIFILTVMSIERYLAVVKPLTTYRKNNGYRRVIISVVWLVSILLALPTMVMTDLREFAKNGTIKRMCGSTWPKHTYRIYLTVLFNTCILTPGILIGFLYIKLARTYWTSQSRKEVTKAPKLKILYMIFGIVLIYDICYLPFWVWQLFHLYIESATISPTTVAIVNLFVTCLAYCNSCINPFLYTLLTKNYKEYLRNQKAKFSKRKCHRVLSQRSTSSGHHPCTESLSYT